MLHMLFVVAYMCFERFKYPSERRISCFQKAKASPKRNGKINEEISKKKVAKESIRLTEKKKELAMKFG